MTEFKYDPRTARDSQQRLQKELMGMGSSWRDGLRDLGRLGRNVIKFAWVLVLIVTLIWVGLSAYSGLDGMGWIPHDRVITVHSPDWQDGEYKTCTTINMSSDAAEGDVLCDGGVPSGDLEDGKAFMVRFWGKTHDEGKPSLDPSVANVAGALLWWKCRKNDGGDPSITCEQEAEPRKSNP